MTPKEARERYGLFLSSVEGHLVARYGSGTRTRPSSLVGASRMPSGEYAWDTSAIAALSHAEAARYAREYRRAIASGALVERTAEDYCAVLDAEHARGQAASAAQQN